MNEHARETTTPTADGFLVDCTCGATYAVTSTHGPNEADDLDIAEIMHRRARDTDYGGDL